MPEERMPEEVQNEPDGPRTDRSAAKRRMIMRAGIVGLVLVLFVLVPGYIATRPGFVQRYEGMSGRYESWASSPHAVVSCQNCHVSPKLLAQATYDLRMVGEFYLSAVLPSRQPALFLDPTNEACLSCHIDLRTVSPSGDLNIPHRAHVTILKMKCVECHNTMVHQSASDEARKPRMTGCLTCHDGKVAKSECSACHTNKDQPSNHQAKDWLVVHPAQKDLKECEQCHKWTAGNWCAHCHESRPASHGRNWRAVHRNQVEVRRNCEACHTAPFCIRCHGVVPRLNFDSSLKLVQ